MKRGIFKEPSILQLHLLASCALALGLLFDVFSDDHSLPTTASPPPTTETNAYSDPETQGKFVLRDISIEQP